MSAVQFPWYHQPAIDIMHARPGTPYLDAVQQVKSARQSNVRNYDAIPAQVTQGMHMDMDMSSFSMGRLVDTSTDENDPFGEPWYYEEATQIMMASPGMEFSTAVEQVKRKRR